MKILIVGTGAVGGYFGGRLANMGKDVTFVARGKRQVLLKQNGLQVESKNGGFNLNVHVQEKPRGAFDLIIFAVKSYHFAEASRLIEKNVSSNTTVLSLLNGVDSEETLGQAFGQEKVLGGIAFIGSTLQESGVISHTAAGSVTIGELSGKKSTRCRDVQKIFSSSGVHCRVSEAIQSDIWAKMIWNVGFNAVTAITGTLVSDVLQFRKTEELIIEAMEEACRVARAEKIPLAENIVLKTMEKTRNAGAIKTSMLQDVERGTQTEIDSLNAAVVRLGEKHGIPVPVNRTLVQLVSYMSRPVALK
ncbi:MAG: ketopantoate reductase family protein [Nitrospinota bacterium]